MSKEIVNKIITGLVIGIIATILGYLFLDKNKKEEQKFARYPISVENNFLESCQDGDKELSSYCGCTLTYLEQNYSIEEFAQIEKEFAITGIYPDAFTNAVNYCTE